MATDRVIPGAAGPEKGWEAVSGTEKQEAASQGLVVLEEEETARETAVD